MMKDDYKIGDEVGIFIGGHQGERTKGTVVYLLDLPDWMFRNYVVEIPTHIDPLLEVRSAFSMRPWKETK